MCKQLFAKSVTPSLFAYGLNVDFTDDESTRFAEILDNISDATAIFELGYQIEASENIKNSF